MKKVVFFTGAGISEESGVPPFRDENGLWYNHDPDVIAHVDTWKKKQNRKENREMMLDFYNARKREMAELKPNAAHHAIAEFEKDERFSVMSITQNVDNFLERAGANLIIHLHGELIKAQSTLDPKTVIEWEGDIKMGDKCPKGSQLRPHVVWFGEDVPMIYAAAEAIAEADIVIVAGTSLQVYPAAQLLQFISKTSKVYIVNPKVDMDFVKTYGSLLNVEPTVFEEKAGTGIPKAINHIKASFAGVRSNS